MDFYKLIFDKRYNEFEGIVEIDDHKVNILVSNLKEEEIKAAYALVKRVLDWVIINKEMIREYAANEELLKLKNKSWLEEEEEQLTKREFKNKIVLESIAINSDASFVIWYGDGNVFWGHGIRVCVSPAFRLAAAEIL